jgi:hypothetical protein
MIHELRISEDLERSGSLGVIEKLPQHLTGEIEENHENPVMISGVSVEIRITYPKMLPLYHPMNFVVFLKK